MKVPKTPIMKKLIKKISNVIGNCRLLPSFFPHPDDVRKYIEREKNRKRCHACRQTISSFPRSLSVWD